jgi:hypothetical protein
MSLSVALSPSDRSSGQLFCTFAERIAVVPFDVPEAHCAATRRPALSPKRVPLPPHRGNAGERAESAATRAQPGL